MPLLIDPNSAATQYLIAEVGGEVTTPNDSKVMNVLELAIRFGKHLVLKEIDRIEGHLINILRREIITMGSRKQVKLGEKWLDF